MRLFTSSGWILILLAGWFFLPRQSFAQDSPQTCDTSFHAVIEAPYFDETSKPSVWIDEGHYNFHTRDGRYCAFTEVLLEDGCEVNRFTGLISKKSLKEVDILVIANSLHQTNASESRNTLPAGEFIGWQDPVSPAFTEEEVEILIDWIDKGGSLLLIADHFPFPGAVEPIAQRLGLTFSPGFALGDYRAPRDFLGRFTITNDSPASTIANLNLSHPIISGQADGCEPVNQIVTFTGSSFKPLESADFRNIQPLITLGENVSNLETEVAWEFTGITPKSAEGWLQGATIEFGKGRVVVMGEAAMLTAQTSRRGGQVSKMGLSHPEAIDNQRFLLNIIHWLAE